MKCAQKPGKPGKPIKMAAGGILAGMESAIDESARRRAEIARKYGVTTGDTVPQPKVEQPAKADQAKPHPQDKGILSGIKGIFTRRNEEIDKAASGYARGGILAGLDEYALLHAGAAKKSDAIIPESLRRGILAGINEEDMLKNQPGIKPVNGAVAQISGPGTGTSDSIPAKLGDTEFKVSNREGIAVLPEKTMRTPGAVDAVKNIIQMTNGLPPKLAIAKGIGFAAGLVEEEKSKDMTAQLDAATKAAEPTGFQSATRPIQPGETGVEMINGVRHSTAPAVTAPALGAAAAETANKVTGGIFDFDARAQANRDRAREELNPTRQVSSQQPEITSAAPGSTAAGAGVNSQKSSSYMADNGLRAFQDKGNGILRGIGMDGKISYSNVGTEGIADPNKTVAVNGINMAESNAALARENAVRQSMIDSQPRGSVGVIGGGSSGGRDDLLKKLMTPHAGAPNGQLTANQINAARGIMADVNEEQLKGAEIAQRVNETDRRMSNDAIGIEQSRFMLDLQRRAAAGDQAAIAGLSAMKGIARPTPSVRDQYLPLESQTTDNSGNVTKSTQYIDPNTGRVVGGQAGASSNGKELPAGVKPQPGKTYLGMMNGKPVFQDENGNKFVDNSYSAG